MTSSLWPQSPVPPSGDVAWQWQVDGLAELPALRAGLRSRLDNSGDDRFRCRILLAVDELASNGLRHGLPPVTVQVLTDEHGWLIIVSDRAPDRRPRPTVDRDRAQGGMGLQLVAELTTSHGWTVETGRKHVWAWLERP